MKWFAPETLRSMEFSIKSDIWSFGVLAWEMYTRAQKPYIMKDDKDLNWETLISILDRGVRPSRPRKYKFGKKSKCAFFAFLPFSMNFEI